MVCLVKGWRLIENPESLCAKVLKGRYYHECDILSATRKKHASHTWRAILAGSDVLQKGLVRRIGDESSTRIWTDRWIPNHFEGRPITSDLNMPATWVAELMTPSGGWNEDLIKQTFLAVDAHAILSTPARGIGPDVWAWGTERHCIYTVRSAYRVLYDDQCRQREENQASSSGDTTWARIWKLCVPPKVRVFCVEISPEFPNYSR